MFFLRDRTKLKGIHRIYGEGWSDKGDACCSEGGKLSIPEANTSKLQHLRALDFRPVHSKPNPVR